MLDSDNRYMTTGVLGRVVMSSNNGPYVLDFNIRRVYLFVNFNFGNLSGSGDNS